MPLDYLIKILYFLSEIPTKNLIKALKIHPHDFKFNLYQNANQLHQVIYEINPIVVVKVGSFLGMSTCDIAKKIKSTGREYAINDWKGSIEHYDFSFLENLYKCSCRMCCREKSNIKLYLLKWVLMKLLR